MLANKDAGQTVQKHKLFCTFDDGTQQNQIFSLQGPFSLLYLQLFVYLSILIVMCVSLVSILSVLCPEYLHCLSFSLYVCLS